MGGGIADAVAANAIGRLIPASASITATDDPARRRLHLRTGPAGLAEFPARPRFQNHFTVRVPPTRYGAPMLGHAGHHDSRPQMLAIQLRLTIRLSYAAVVG